MLRLSKRLARSPTFLSRNCATRAPKDGKLAAAPEQPSGSGGGFAMFVALPLATMGFLAYRCEESSEFANMIDGFSPMVTKALSPFRTAVKFIDLPKILAPIMPKKPDAPVKKTETPEVVEQVQQKPPVVVEEVKTPEVAQESVAAAVPVPKENNNSNTRTTEEVEIEVTPPSTEANNASEKHHEQQQQEEDDEELQQSSESENKNEVTAAPEQTASRQKVDTHGADVHVHQDPHLQNMPVPEVRAMERNIVKAMRADASRLASDMKRDLELALLRNAHMDEESVNKIIQLASEQFERVSYEIIVLQQSLHAVESEVDARYRDLMRAQHNTMEDQLRQKLHDQEDIHIATTAAKLQDMAENYKVQLQEAVAAKAHEFESKIAAERAEEREEVRAHLQEQMFESLAAVEKQNSAHLLDMQAKIEEVNARVMAFNNVLDQNEGVIKKTIATHTISGALLALEMAINAASRVRGDEQRIANSLKSLRNLCSEDTFVVNVLDSLPERVVQNGAPTLSELQVRFQVMRDEVRKAALAPDNAPQLVGQIIGTLMASIASAPKGYVSGDGVEERLARAQFELERGRVRQAVKEIEGVEGYTAVLMADWRQMAEDSLLVEQSLKSLKARAVVLHRQFS